jgi:hypothetical protein
VQPAEPTADIEAPSEPSEPSAPVVAESPEVEETPEAELPPATPRGVRALTAEQRAAFWDTPEDPPTEVRMGETKELVGKQYLAGNEKTLYTFREKIEGLGGGYVGVGSDQAYFFIGWSRPEFAWLIDYDADVVAIHAVYRAFLDHARTPEEFLALWAKDTRKTSVKHIESGSTEETKALRVLYLRHRGWIDRRLQAQVKRMRRAKIPSWLSDQETYDFVRDLVLADRVRPMVTNLLEPGAMRGVAKSAKELGVPVRVLYLSNAEEYWKDYPQVFRDNILGLPIDDLSIVLRTLLIWDVNQDYRYNTQAASNYTTWLRTPWIRSVWDVVHTRGEASKTEINYFESGGAPEDSPRARQLERSGSAGSATD